MSEEYKIRDSDEVTVTLMNDIYEVQYLQRNNTKASIKKLSADEYIVLETGEIKVFDKFENRSDSENSIRKTLKKLRYLINASFMGGDNELFVTFTYKDVVRDTKQVYKDWRNFLKRFKRKWNDVEYLAVLEPQGETHGYCWHIHALMKFVNHDYIEIDNNREMYPLWGHGFTKTERLKEVDNIGAYLSAYLSNIEVEQTEEKENDKEKSKRYKKGERLKYYPKGMNIYRKSKGIEMPKRLTMSYREAKELIGEDLKPVIRKTFPIKTDEFENLIIFEEYNTRRNNSRKGGELDDNTNGE